MIQYVNKKKINTTLKKDQINLDGITRENIK